MSCSPVTLVQTAPLHHPRRHAAVRTEDYLFAQLIPYLGNKRKLLHLIAAGVEACGCRAGTFADLFAGSTVVARWAKQAGYRVIANDWEPYAHQIALGTVVPNRAPQFAGLGGTEAVFQQLNHLPPRRGYVATHLCPQSDQQPHPESERMFFTQANGRRIDAVGEQIAAWTGAGLLSEAERAYLLSALLYAVSYVSNTSGVFKGFHRGWGGKTSTALYRILSPLTLHPPPLFDNRQTNLAFQLDAGELAGQLSELARGQELIVYLDPPYNQHPYGSNYHLLNTIALWDKPAISPTINPSRRGDKSAIRTDWRTLRRSPYNHADQAGQALEQLLDRLSGARWILTSYSTDGNIPLPALLKSLASRGRLRLFIQSYKRYRVSTPRMSPKPRNVEIVALLDVRGKPNPRQAGAMAEAVLAQEKRT